MNMPAFNLQQTQTPAQIANIGHFTTIGNIRWQSAYQLMVNPQLVTQMLDERFPLDNGSHADVKQYIVYFRHVMAFFKDGSHCGFKQPKQFVALCGHKETPESIILKENDLHVEIRFNRNGTRGQTHCAGIQDIQVELATEREFTAPDGSSYFI